MSTDFFRVQVGANWSVDSDIGSYPTESRTCRTISCSLDWKLNWTARDGFIGLLYISLSSFSWSRCLFKFFLPSWAVRYGEPGMLLQYLWLDHWPFLFFDHGSKNFYRILSPKSFLSIIRTPVRVFFHVVTFRSKVPMWFVWLSLLTSFSFKVTSSSSS